MKALVAATGGIGDMIRVSPLIRALSILGWQVDALLSTDYPEAIELFEGTPEIRRIFFFPDAGDPVTAPRIEGLREETYDLAVIKSRDIRLSPLIHASRRIWASRAWISSGDPYFVARAAAKLGWRGEMPHPFVRDSGRQFHLPPGTVAIHPGCNPKRHWKKWHGYGELARMFEHVVVVGSLDDRKLEATYFGQQFLWPPHVTDFTGRLSLLDTASLLRQTRLLVSNDSGLMHLAVAVGTPTLGIFGITSPEREAIPVPHMHSITKGLPCEPRCRTESVFRHDCEYHLECMKTLTPLEVYRRSVEITKLD